MGAGSAVGGIPPSATVRAHVPRLVPPRVVTPQAAPSPASAAEGRAAQVIAEANRLAAEQETAEAVLAEARRAEAEAYENVAALESGGSSRRRGSRNRRDQPAAAWPRNPTPPTPRGLQPVPPPAPAVGTPTAGAASSADVAGSPATSESRRRRQEHAMLLHAEQVRGVASNLEAARESYWPYGSTAPSSGSGYSGSVPEPYRDMILPPPSDRSRSGVRAPRLVDPAEAHAGARMPAARPYSGRGSRVAELLENYAGGEVHQRESVGMGSGAEHYDVCD